MSLQQLLASLLVAWHVRAYKQNPFARMHLYDGRTASRLRAVCEHFDLMPEPADEPDEEPNDADEN